MVGQLFVQGPCVQFAVPNNMRNGINDPLRFQDHHVAKIRVVIKDKVSVNTIGGENMRK